MTEKQPLLQPVDAAVRRQAQALVRQARFAALGTLERDGFPAVSRIAITTAMSGDVGFLISGLSGHFGNLARDGRCSLLLGEPGKGDPLAHPRLTLIGQAQRLDTGPAREALRARHLMRHPKSALYADFADFAFWLFRIERAALNGGFGKASALTRDDLTLNPEAVASLSGIEAGAVAHMNADHGAALDRMAARAGAKGSGWRLACLDPDGIDLTHGDDTERIWFDTPLTSAADLRPALLSLARA